VSAPLGRRLAAEALGTAFLLAIIIGSGIMGERLAGGNVGIALLANSLATGFGLAALIFVFAPVSGAHFNPVVTLSLASGGLLPWKDVAPYIGVQVAAAVAGVIAAHGMFDEPWIALSTKARTGPSQWWSEIVATFGLLMMIWGCMRRDVGAVALAVGGYIAAAYWFTASTSFANPAVTLARSLSDTFAGIRLLDAPVFIVAQLLGAAAATAAMRALTR